jgi:AhpC/TSA family
MNRPEVRPDPRYGRYVGVLALLIIGLVTITTLTTAPSGITGIEPGHAIPPFAVPLALGNLGGDANVATPSDLGAAGHVPACAVRGSQILNVCQLYERGPVVLVLFIEGGSCEAILGDVQSLLPSFPGVGFAAVAIKPNRDQVRRLVRKHGFTFPVGIDHDGALAALYKVVSCPQVTFALPGGLVQSRALLTRPSLATLRERVRELVLAARAHGWKGPGA